MISAWCNRASAAQPVVYFLLFEIDDLGTRLRGQSQSLGHPVAAIIMAANTELADGPTRGERVIGTQAILLLNGRQRRYKTYGSAQSRVFLRRGGAGIPIALQPSSALLLCPHCAALGAATWTTAAAGKVIWLSTATFIQN